MKCCQKTCSHLHNIMHGIALKHIPSKNYKVWLAQRPKLMMTFRKMFTVTVQLLYLPSCNFTRPTFFFLHVIFTASRVQDTSVLSKIAGAGQSKRTIKLNPFSYLIWNVVHDSWNFHTPPATSYMNWMFGSILLCCKICVKTVASAIAKCCTYTSKSATANLCSCIRTSKTANATASFCSCNYICTCNSFDRHRICNKSSWRICRSLANKLCCFSKIFTSPEALWRLKKTLQHWNLRATWRGRSPCLLRLGC